MWLSWLLLIMFSYVLGRIGEMELGVVVMLVVGCGGMWNGLL